MANLLIDLALKNIKPHFTTRKDNSYGHLYISDFSFLKCDS
jgi:hypothetical protein